jgi:hypothetical protein
MHGGNSEIKGLIQRRKERLAQQSVGAQRGGNFVLPWNASLLGGIRRLRGGI